MKLKVSFTFGEGWSFLPPLLRKSWRELAGMNTASQAG